MDDEQRRVWLDEVVAEAERAARGQAGGPFAAIVVRDGEAIATARNTVLRDVDPTAHAEVNAIREATHALGHFDLAGCELFASCEPCPMCHGAILWSRVDAAWYAATRHDAAAVGFGDADFHEVLRGDADSPVQRLKGNDGTAPFDAYARRDDAQRY